MLYPQNNQRRSVFSLDGIWDFKLLADGEAALLDPAQPLSEALSMPVPSAYNDIYPGKDFREHVGDMVYQREFELNPAMRGGRLWLRFGSVTHRARVFVNAVLACEHTGGFLPFECEISAWLKTGKNRLTVFVNNLIDYENIPCGRTVRTVDENGQERLLNLPNFDFFNYSGIMRPVCLYTTPQASIRDLSIVAGANGRLCWAVEHDAAKGANLRVQVLDAQDRLCAEAEGASGELWLKGPQLWDTEHPYLYQLKCELRTADGCDEYTESFGFRDVSVEGNRLCLNRRVIYLTGFGKHEDYPVHGRGFDECVNVKDIALLKWMGANSFRTSHYPYSEEMMRLCDREGILVIDEVPAVGLNNAFTATGLLGGDPSGTWKILKTEKLHRAAIEELVRRDKNHPCVVMWSVANEPASQEPGAKAYFAPMFELFRRLDKQKRPVTLVTYDGATPENCEITELCDVICCNRYYGWYQDEEDLRSARYHLARTLEGYHRRCPDKPIMLTEYGADTVAGMHDINAGLFSEEYQCELLKMYGELFDAYPYVTGEHVWNFADFATAANIKRVQGNKKGVFTRERQPKAAAWFLRKRWTGLKKV